MNCTRCGKTDNVFYGLPGTLVANVCFECLQKAEKKIAEARENLLREFDSLDNQPPGAIGKTVMVVGGPGSIAKKPALPPDPAHTCPIASVPGKTVVEKFLIQIETPELPNYCACDCCRDGRRALWRAIISAQISNRLNGADPFKVHPKKHVLTISAEQ